MANATMLEAYKYLYLNKLDVRLWEMLWDECRTCQRYDFDIIYHQHQEHTTCKLSRKDALDKYLETVRWQFGVPGLENAVLRALLDNRRNRRPNPPRGVYLILRNFGRARLDLIEAIHQQPLESLKTDMMEPIPNRYLEAFSFARL